MSEMLKYFYKLIKWYTFIEKVNNGEPAWKILRQPNERAWKDDHFDIQNMGSTINIKAAMKAKKFESPCM